MTTILTQGGSVTEKRLYDDFQQLCKMVRPETGLTVFGYNDQRQIAWQAEGTYGSTFMCDVEKVPSNHKVQFSYDNLGQLRTKNFPDSTPDRTYSYDANGNLKQLKAGSIIWNYDYNSKNAIELEKLTLDGKSFTLDWEYNSLGAVSSLTYPSGLNVSYSPNALGQPTKAGNYVTNVKYHPNGQVKSFTYGNGITRNVALDGTGRIDLIDDKKSSLLKVKLDPSYDKNDNLARLIDYQNRRYDIDNLNYDGVNRLKAADGKWGTGDYTYDGLGNIKSRRFNNSTITYHYNSLNRLSHLTGAYGYDYAYDTRGNITNNERFALAYNRANQMTSANGATYTYDGHNRRVKKAKGGNHYSVYSQSGQLLHRLAADGKKTDSVYLGKQIVAEVDKRGSTPPPTPEPEPVPAPTINFTVSYSYVYDYCLHQIGGCTGPVDPNPPVFLSTTSSVTGSVALPFPPKKGKKMHKLTWTTEGATSCAGSVRRLDDGWAKVISGTASTLSKFFEDVGRYRATLTCSGAGGSTSKSTEFGRYLVSPTNSHI